MDTSNITFSQIVATPTQSGWSQVYNAGKLFSVLSLTKENANESETLGILGKEIFKTLEEEYFTLEEKSFESIRKAVDLTSKKIPQEVDSTFIVISIVGNILYVFGKGTGKTILKREEKIGTILNLNNSEITGASGFLENEDLIIVGTKEFLNIINEDSLKSSLDNQSPNDIAENLSPKIHEKEEGAASSIIIRYKNEEKEKVDGGEKDEQEEIIEEKTDRINPLNKTNETEKEIKLSPKLKLSLPKIKISSFKKLRVGKLNHSKKAFLMIAVILVAVLGSSIFFAFKKQEDAKTQKLFQEIYPEAQKKFDEGNALLSLNSNLAREDFSQSLKILENGKSKFKKDSNEAKQINSLIKKINGLMGSASNAYSTKTNLVDMDKSPLLSEENKSNALYATLDSNLIYLLNEKGISKVENGKEKEIIKKDWSNPSGIGVFYGNVYVLDKKEGQVLKFVATDNGFSKTNYLPSPIDLSNAKAMAIDGSIYVLLKDNILKFTKGKGDSFKLSGLDKPFLNPQRIFTNADTDNLYILDKGNLRIVVLGKDGGYKAQYKAGILKDAKDIEVFEKDKKIYILSSGKLYQMDLN